MSIEAMKQALDALEFIPESGSMLGMQAEAKRIQAITALRQAIEQAEQAHAIDTSQERVDEIVKQEHDRAVELAQAYERGWKAALAQQEPVAWISDSPTKGNGRQLHWTKAEAWRWSSNITPLYTAPPPRKPLTDEEIETIANDFEEGYVFLYRSFARAIESAHGIGEKA